MEPARKVRMTLELTPEVNARLDQLAEDLGTSRSEVLRKAIALIAVASEAKQRGQRIALADPGQPVAAEILGL